jgi:subtilisin family serine protease
MGHKANQGEDGPSRHQSGNTAPSSDEIRWALSKARISNDLMVQLPGEGRENSKESHQDRPGQAFNVIIEVNADAPGGPVETRRLLLDWLLGKRTSEEQPDRDQGGHLRVFTEAGGERREAPPELSEDEHVAANKSRLTERYVFARLLPATIELVASCMIEDEEHEAQEFSAVYKVWADHKLKPFMFESERTIKADAARAAFGISGKGITWAVADSGIDARHPHFHLYDTLELPPGLSHRDFTLPDTDFHNQAGQTALTDESGHGTHVAAIIAGECVQWFSRWLATAPGKMRLHDRVREIKVTQKYRRKKHDYGTKTVDGPPSIRGIAPLAKLVSLRVVSGKRDETGDESNLLAAIGYIQRANNYGQRIRIHGLNISVGYEFEPEWFAAGHSPLCNEVNRLVRSGVCVVVAAGNAGYGRVTTWQGKTPQAALPCTISDPGNAELAITVGATHRDRPHTYGASYFSSKGPTADGRRKPDLLAPGERIISAAANSEESGVAHYREDSGTSMAAPHVSGSIAALLSIRTEFCGEPLTVKSLLMDSATDLGREASFQGRGLIDLMRAIQSV